MFYLGMKDTTNDGTEEKIFYIVVYHCNHILVVTVNIINGI